MSRFIKLATAMAAILAAANVSAGNSCTAIKDGGITDVAGNEVSLGYDVYGYNYQAHMFNGFYDNYSRPEVPFTEGDVWLQMKWSDSWLSKYDCDGDNKLDRGYGLNESGISQGWLTNHENGVYENVAGETCEYSYFVKIVYLPDTCNAENQIWNSFCIVQEELDDPCGEYGYTPLESLINPGLGHYK